MAHQPLALVARLLVHPAWRQPQWAGADDGQPLYHDAPWRLVARSELDVCGLGGLSRSAVDNSATSAEIARAPGFPADWNVRDVSSCVCRMGLIPCADVCRRD